MHVFEKAGCTPLCATDIALPLVETWGQRQRKGLCNIDRVKNLGLW